MFSFDTTCKECGTKFDSPESLHAHVRTHRISIENYYLKHFPRFNLFNKKPLPFPSFEGYWQSSFARPEELKAFLNMASDEEKRNWITYSFAWRIWFKQLPLAPSQAYWASIKLMPDILICESLFGSYADFCKSINTFPLLQCVGKLEPKTLPQDFVVCIDTREQQPLQFSNSKKTKLSFGDYTTTGAYYDYTYIDRKNPNDFKSTLVQGYERFCEEIERVIKAKAYLFIVVDDSIQNIEYENEKSYHKANLPFVFKRMRDLIYKYPSNIQFVFSGSRKNSERIIPYILLHGKQLWNLDVQYIIDKRACGK